MKHTTRFERDPEERRKLLEEYERDSETASTIVAAMILRVTRSTVTRWIESGRLRAYFTDGRVNGEGFIKRWRVYVSSIRTEFDRQKGNR